MKIWINIYKETINLILKILYINKRNIKFYLEKKITNFTTNFEELKKILEENDKIDINDNDTENDKPNNETCSKINILKKQITIIKKSLKFFKNFLNKIYKMKKKVNKDFFNENTF